jgi:hypothetical protein
MGNLAGDHAVAFEWRQGAALICSIKIDTQKITSAIGKLRCQDLRPAATTKILGMGYHMPQWLQIGLVGVNPTATQNSFQLGSPVAQLVKALPRHVC